MRAPLFAIFVLLCGACAHSGRPPERVVHEPSGLTFILVDQRFYLSRTEVTVAAFRRFVEATGYVTDAERGVEEGGHTVGAFAATPDGDRGWNASASWRNPFPHLPEYEPREDHPVVHVSWNDARAFAAHFGLRLQTEAEWQRADAGGDRGNVADATAHRRFPSWSSVHSFDDGVALLAPAGAYPPNRLGFHNLTGNVAEWCEDRFGEGGARVLRGSSWLDGPLQTDTRAGMRPQSRRDFIGFRVSMPVY